MALTFALLLHHDNCGARGNLQRSGNGLGLGQFGCRGDKRACIWDLYHRRNGAALLHVDHYDRSLSGRGLKYRIAMSAV